MNNDEVEHDKNKKVSRLRYIIPVIVILLLISAALLFAALTQENKPDPASEYFIRRKAADLINTKTILNKEPNDLNDIDFAKIIKLSIVGYAWDIRLLEKFTNLRELELRNISYPKNAIPKWIMFLEKYGIYKPGERFSLNLSPIRKLTNLEILNLESSSCKNIKPVSNLTNLQHLILNGTKVTNLKPIKGMVNLNSLYLVGTKVSDLRPLMELKNLKRLYIRGCKNITEKQVEDLQKALPNLMIFK